jgi:predicted LPLAT superfamily acyltransferase
VEMSDAELSAWHANLRSHRNPMTLRAHLNEVGVTKAVRTVKPKVNIDEFQ